MVGFAIAERPALRCLGELKVNDIPELQLFGGNRGLKRFVDELEALGGGEPRPGQQSAAGPACRRTDRRREIDLADTAIEFGRQFQATLALRLGKVAQRRL